MKQLCYNRFGVLLGMWVEHLRRWLEEARETETLDTSNWKKVVDLVQKELRNRQLTKETTWQAVVLIPKGGGEFWGIRTIKVLCKMVVVILNHRLGATITLYNFLNGLRDGRVMGTASLEEILFQKLMAVR